MSWIIKAKNIKIDCVKVYGNNKLQMEIVKVLYKWRNIDE